MTRCKMACNEIIQHSKTATTYKFTPVMDNDPKSENGKFWEFTPTGVLEIGYAKGTLNFEIGKEYYIDVSEAPSK